MYQLIKTSILADASVRTAVGSVSVNRRRLPSARRRICAGNNRMRWAAAGAGKIPARGRKNRQVVEVDLRAKLKSLKLAVKGRKMFFIL